MKFTPYDYQKTAIRWILTKERCGLFLDMGLGKTVSTLTAVQDMIDDCEITNALVVAPKKVAETTWTTSSMLSSPAASPASSLKRTPAASSAWRGS